MRVTPPALSPFFFSATATTEIYTLSLHDALPIYAPITSGILRALPGADVEAAPPARRSEEHTSELQSRRDLVCRLLLEKKNRARCYRSRRAGRPTGVAEARLARRSECDSYRASRP